MHSLVVIVKIIYPKIDPGLLLLIHKEPSHSLTGTNAHTRHQDLLLGLLRFAENGTNLSRTSRPEWMAQGNSSTSRVHLGMIEAEFVETINGHGSKGLIDLVDINVGLF